MARMRSCPSTFSSTRYLAGWPFPASARPTTRPCRPLYSVCCLSPSTMTAWPLLRPPRWPAGAAGLLSGLLRKLLSNGQATTAPKTRTCITAGPASSVESANLLNAFTALSCRRPIIPLGPVSSSTAPGNGGSPVRSREGQSLLPDKLVPAARSCCNHWVRSRCANSRSTTGFAKTVAFSVSPATAAVHMPLASAAGGPCSDKSGLSASCQAAPPFVPSCRSQKHSNPCPACCLTSLHASRNRRSALRAASSRPRAPAGTRKRATQEQGAAHSPPHRSWKDALVNSGSSLCELTCSAKRPEPSCTVCGCCVAPCRVAGSMTRKQGQRCTLKRSTTHRCAPSCAKWWVPARRSAAA
mmetsp:Transcript_104273/g.331583  ORF Transcript_104273/g.331583 Transcript_104273/m.331583 type:complete len:355 (-) Transcript_104273:838-1902(-)